MKTERRFILSFLLLIGAILLLVGCGNSTNEHPSSQNNSDKLEKSKEVFGKFEFVSVESNGEEYSREEFIKELQPSMFIASLDFSKTTDSIGTVMIERHVDKESVVRFKNLSNVGTGPESKGLEKKGEGVYIQKTRFEQESPKEGKIFLPNLVDPSQQPDEVSFVLVEGRLELHSEGTILVFKKVDDDTPTATVSDLLDEEAAKGEPEWSWNEASRTFVTSDGVSVTVDNTETKPQEYSEENMLVFHFTIKNGSQEQVSIIRLFGTVIKFYQEDGNTMTHVGVMNEDLMAPDALGTAQSGDLQSGGEITGTFGIRVKDSRPIVVKFFNNNPYGIQDENPDASLTINP